MSLRHGIIAIFFLLPSLSFAGASLEECKTRTKPPTYERALAAKDSDCIEAFIKDGLASGGPKTGLALAFTAVRADNVDALAVLKKNGVDLAQAKCKLRADASRCQLQAYKYLVSNTSCAPELTVKNVLVYHDTPTDLHRFAKCSELDGVRYLIEQKGANPNGSTNPVFNVLYTVAADGNAEMFKYLVSKGANPRVSPPSMGTLLHFVARNPNADPGFIDLVAKSGIDLKAKDLSGSTALHVAVVSRSPRAVEYFVKKGISTREKDGNGETPVESLMKTYPWTHGGSGFDMLMTLLDDGGGDIQPLLSDKWAQSSDEFWQTLLLKRKPGSKWRLPPEAPVRARDCEYVLDMIEQRPQDLDADIVLEFKPPVAELTYRVLEAMRKSYPLQGRQIKLTPEQVNGVVGSLVPARHAIKSSAYDVDRSFENLIWLADNIYPRVDAQFLQDALNMVEEYTPDRVERVHRKHLLELLARLQAEIKVGKRSPSDLKSDFEGVLNRFENHQEGVGAEALVEMVRIARELKIAADDPIFDSLRDNKKKFIAQVEYAALKEAVEQKRSYTAPAVNPTPWDLTKLHANLSKAKSSSVVLTGEELSEEGPLDYYRSIIDAARAPGSISVDRFKPTVDDARRVIQALVRQPVVNEKDYSAVTWLIARSRAALDEKLLDDIAFSDDELSKEVAEALRTRADTYKKSPNLAAIKLMKALLLMPDENFECNAEAGGRLIASEKGDYLLNWIVTLGEQQAPEPADHVLFARLMQIFLNRHSTACASIRSGFTSVLRAWQKTNPEVQHELVCLLAGEANSPLLHERNLDGLMMVSNAVGLRSNLSQNSFLEQLGALSELKGDASYTTVVALDASDGLLRYVLGNPAGTVKNFVDDSLTIPAKEANRCALVKLCRIRSHIDQKAAKVDASKLDEKTKRYLEAIGSSQDFVHDEESKKRLRAGMDFWLATLKIQLAKPRPWPEGFAATAPSYDPGRSLEQEFQDLGLDQDLLVIQNGCTDEVLEKTKSCGGRTQTPPAASKPAPSRAPVPKKKVPLKDWDFQPRGRAH